MYKKLQPKQRMNNDSNSKILSNGMTKSQNLYSTKYSYSLASRLLMIQLVSPAVKHPGQQEMKL